MKFFPKLLLVLIPLVAIPSISVSVTVAYRGNRIIREQVLRNAQLELDRFRSLCLEEASTLEKLGLEQIDFYRDGAQRRALEYIDSKDSSWGFLFVIDGTTGIPVSLAEDIDEGIVSILDDFEPWHWRIGAAVRYSYINAFLSDSLRDTFLLLSGLLVIIVFIILMLARYLVRPIQALGFGAERMSAGDLAVRVPVTTRDELGSLGQIFNEMAENIQHLTGNLEDQVIERTEALSSSLTELRNAQDLLIRRERMANLGGIVAGVAHEINTPLGIGVTSSSYIKDLIKEVSVKLKDDTLSMQDFEEFLADASKASDLLLENLDRARVLVVNFKQLAVEQTVEEMRSFKLADYISTIVEGMYPRLRPTSISINLEIEPNLEIYGYPGYFYQIFSNLIINSLVHAYDQDVKGTISISAREEGTDILMIYRDDGKGMSHDLAEKIYEPFVTTRSNDGGSGLGMNIVFNLVNRRLNGDINLKTSPGAGVEFSIKFPKRTE